MLTPELREEIVGLLLDYREAKDAAAEIRIDMLMVAVEHCGGNQAKLQNGDVALYLDGFLVGAGVMQDFRKE